MNTKTDVLPIRSSMRCPGAGFHGGLRSEGIQEGMRGLDGEGVNRLTGQFTAQGAVDQLMLTHSG